MIMRACRKSVTQGRSWVPPRSKRPRRTPATPTRQRRSERYGVSISRPTRSSGRRGRGAGISLTPTFAGCDCRFARFRCRAIGFSPRSGRRGAQSCRWRRARGGAWSTTKRHEAAYTGFVLELHRRLVAAQVATSFECGSTALRYWPGLVDLRRRRAGACGPDRAGAGGRGLDGGRDGRRSLLGLPVAGRNVLPAQPTRHLRAASAAARSSAVTGWRIRNCREFMSRA